jgi:Phosphotransferase enzyme family
MTRETILTGGRTTTGVVRIGATVRRPRQPNDALARALLKHLEHTGFEGAPRHLGVDEADRNILSFIDGEVPPELGWHSDDVLRAAARLIRRYHDATEGFPAVATGHATGCEVVCHNDLSPCNAVFRDDRPVALIDFDSAAPGTRLHDLGYAAWLWLDLGDDDIDIDADMQRHRLRLFAQTYGFAGDIAELVDAILARQQLLIEEARSQARNETAEWAAYCRQWALKNLRSAR